MVRIVRAGLAVLAAVALMLAPGVAHADQQQPQTGLGLDITSSQGTYRPGEQVTLTFHVTNHGPAACSVGTIADGEALIASVTRDGASQQWGVSQEEYNVDYGAILAGGLVTVQPGASVDVAVHAATGPGAATQPLQTMSMLRTGVGLSSVWSLNAAGRYVVSARYKTPDIPDSTQRICAGATNVATVAFTIGAAHKGFPWWLLLIALAVLVLLILVILALRRSRRRRRERRGAPAAAAFALLILFTATATATGVQAARPLPAHADGGIDAMADACMTSFTGPGVEPGLMDKIKKMRASGQLKIVPAPEWGDNTDWAPGTMTDDKPPYNVVIHWDPVTNNLFKNDSGAPNMPCTRLLHEMIHSEGFADGSANLSTTCYLGGFPHATEKNSFNNMDEVRTIEWENQYRLSEHLGLRTRHDARDDGLAGPLDPNPGMVGQPVPPVPDSAKNESPADQVAAAMGQCSPTPIDPLPSLFDKFLAWVTGDPHVGTMDHLYYDFQAVGEFELAKSRDDFEVQVRQAPLDPADRTISVVTAAAVRAGSDVVGFSDVGGDIQVHRGGTVVTLQKGSVKLPGGGTLTRRSGVYDYGGDGYDVLWPDGSRVAVDPVGSEGLMVNVTPAAARKGTFTGLLGDFDGKAAGDLVSRDGKTIPDQPGYDDLYHVFGDSWRVSQNESLLEYGPGQSTATFTDRAFPDKPATVASLPQSVRDQATAMCKAAHVTDPTLLDACVLDVARTGDPAFATAYAQDQARLGTAGTGGSTPTGPVGGPTPDKGPKPGAILQDGDVVTGSIDQAGGTVDYGLNLAANEQFELVDVSEGMSAVVPDTPSATPMLPGPFQFAVAANGQAKLRVSIPNGTGKYSFRYVTIKPRTIPIEVGAPALSADLDVPGRVDVYRFTPGSDVTAVQVDSTTACAGGPTYGYADDGPQPSVLSPGQLCFGYAHPVSPGAAEQILVWSDGAKTMPYSISLQRS
ncbi:hypothetical protein ABH920_006676 [Catenulispora sp. EB89]